MDEKPFVLALSGPPGSGKTTLALELQRRQPEARIVSLDKHQPLLRRSQPEIREWFARGANPDEFDHSEIVAELTRETQSRPKLQHRTLLLFETPYGRSHEKTGAFIDFLVWLDTPLDIALSRAVLASTEAALRNPAPEAARDFISWQIAYMKFYPTARVMYWQQVQQVAPKADLRLDGSRPPEASAVAIGRALTSHGITL